MGVCCVKQHKPDQGEFVEHTKRPGLVELLKGNTDSISKIIMIQSMMRMHLAIKNYKSLKDNKQIIAKKAIPAQNVEMVSENEKVVELEEKLGPFRHGEVKDEPEREQRQPVGLDNGAKYYGQWYILMSFLIAGMWRQT
jgi:hypothetical protein